MNENKNNQKNSLAALRSETLGFSMMPMGVLPSVLQELETESSTERVPRAPAAPRRSVPWSLWLRLRFRRLRRAFG